MGAGEGPLEWLGDLAVVPAGGAVVRRAPQASQSRWGERLALPDRKVELDLVGEGRLGLDESVERVLPGLLPFGRQITIRQLLNHTSGVLDTNDVQHASQQDWAKGLFRIKDSRFHAEVVALRNRLKRNPAFEFSPLVWIKLAATQPLAFSPGTSFYYSNIGYEVLGLVSSRLLGRPLARLYDERIIKPLV